MPMLQQGKTSFFPRSTSKLWVLLLTILVVSFPTDISCSSGEGRLIHDLFKDYNKLERPVENASDPIKVNFGVTLQQILEVDETKHIVTSNMWLKMEWTDYNLKWNESDYDNIKSIKIPPSSLWMPDILMYNSANFDSLQAELTKVIVSSDGSLLYIPPQISESTCQLELQWFPFDEQECKFKFGSWTYSGWMIDLQLASNEMDLSDFIKNAEWDVIKSEAKRHAIYYQCCPEPYLDITFSLIMQRRPIYYIYNLIIPSIIISVMVIITFTLPAACREKLYLGVTSFLCFTIFKCLSSSSIPANAESNTLLGEYFTLLWCMTASSVICTILSLNFHYRTADTHTMSPLIRKMFLNWMPYILCMRRIKDDGSEAIIVNKESNKNLSLKSWLSNILRIGSKGNDSQSKIEEGNLKLSNEAFEKDTNQINRHLQSNTEELHLILKEIQVITNTMNAQKDKKEIENDWKFAAKVLDRMFLILHILYLFGTLLPLLIAGHR